MEEPLQQRVNERKIYEEIVNMIVDAVYKEFGNNLDARLRIYKLVADNFDGLARSFQGPKPMDPTLIEIIENGEEF